MLTPLADSLRALSTNAESAWTWLFIGLLAAVIAWFVAGEILTRRRWRQQEVRNELNAASLALVTDPEEVARIDRAMGRYAEANRDIEAYDRELLDATRRREQARHAVTRREANRERMEAAGDVPWWRGTDPETAGLERLLRAVDGDGAA